MTKDQAIKACKQGAYAGFVAAGLGLVFIVVALSANWQQGSWALLNDPANFFDVAFVTACAIGLLRMSRASAVVITVYHVVARAYFWVAGALTGFAVIVALIFLFFYVRAIFGAFVFHGLEKAENPDYRAAPKWMYWSGISVGLLALLLMVGGLLTKTSVIPSTAVLSGEEIPPAEEATLRNVGIIDPDEDIVYFYSDGITSVVNAGNILTEDRVIRYFVDEFDELAIYELYLDEIASVRLELQGNFFNDSVYRVSGRDPDAWFLLALSTELGGDVRFIEELRSRIE